MKKFEHLVYDIESKDGSELQEFFKNVPLGSEFELVTILPFQKMIKSVVNMNIQPKIEMHLLLIFKREILCQE